MSIAIRAIGAAADAVKQLVPELVSDFVVGGITNLDETLWGEDARAEASRRLGRVRWVSLSRPLIPEVIALRDRLHAGGVNARWQGRVIAGALRSPNTISALSTN